MNIYFKSNIIAVNTHNFNALGVYTYVGRRGIKYFTDAATIPLSDLEPLGLNFSPSEGL
jgi:hypothetical protein